MAHIVRRTLRVALVAIVLVSGAALALGGQSTAYAHAAQSAAPVSTASTIYVGSNDESIYAFAASTGAIIWRKNLGSGVVWEPAIASGTAYVPAGDTLYALNAATGAQRWTYTARGGLYPPTANGAGVYVASEDGNLYALDAVTGVYRWSQPIGSNDWFKPVVLNGAVYTSEPVGPLVAFNASTGSPLWSKFYPVYSDIRGVNGVLYFGTLTGDLDAVGASDGLLLWQYHIGSAAIQSRPTIANGAVYFGTDGGSVYAVNLSTHLLVWRYQAPMPVQTRPAVNGSVVYIGAKTSVIALRTSDGTPIWRHNLDSQIYKAGVIATAGLVFSGTYAGGFYALKPGGGRVAWSYTTGGAILAPPATA